MEFGRADLLPRQASEGGLMKRRGKQLALDEPASPSHGSLSARSAVTARFVSKSSEYRPNWQS